jgi:hypothetical protein
MQTVVLKGHHYKFFFDIFPLARRMPDEWTGAYIKYVTGSEEGMQQR